MPTPHPPLLPVVLGPTASGKTRLAAHLAAHFGGTVISADSRQIYRGMDIGTGKDLGEYVVDGTPVPYRLIDCQDAGVRYHINDFYEDFAEAFREAVREGRLPLLCGGSGLYLEIALTGHPLAAVPVDLGQRAVWEAWPTEALLQALAQYPEPCRAHADTSTRKRLVRALEVAAYLNAHGTPPPRQPLPARPLLLGTLLPVALRRARITARLRQRLEHGLIEEVQRLLDQGLPQSMLDYYGLEYKWVGSFLQGEIDRNLLFERLNTAIHRFAKRQMTWFRKMENDGWKIHWIDATAPFERQLEEAKSLIGSNL